MNGLTERYGCVPHATGQKDGRRFYINAKTEEVAVANAKEKAKDLGFTSVFVETDKGRQIYDGKVE